MNPISNLSFLIPLQSLYLRWRPKLYFYDFTYCHIEISSTDWLLPSHLLWHMMLMVRPIRALCRHDVHSNCYWITGIGVMDGTHGQSGHREWQNYPSLIICNYRDVPPCHRLHNFFKSLTGNWNTSSTWPLASTFVSQSKLWIWSSNGCSLCQSGEETTRENKTRKLPTPASSICIWTHIDCCYTIVMLLDCCLVKFWLQ